MSTPAHESHLAKISCNPMASSPAPVHEGQAHSYFNDEATRLLLGLDAGAIPLHSGAYGEAEPGVQPVKLSLLHAKVYDQILLPFIPNNHEFHHKQISMYEKKWQYTIHLEARQELDRFLSKALIDALTSVKEIGLNLPNYALTLVPRLRYQAGGDK